MLTLLITGLSSGRYFQFEKYFQILITHRTWPGKQGEEWSSAQCLESVLISIQSLMSSNPYENEPGYEDADSAEDQQAMADYVAKVFYIKLTSVLYV